jgi:tellurite resistance protein TehA-like permease
MRRMLSSRREKDAAKLFLIAGILFSLSVGLCALAYIQNALHSTPEVTLSGLPLVFPLIGILLSGLVAIIAGKELNPKWDPTWAVVLVGMAAFCAFLDVLCLASHAL